MEIMEGLGKAVFSCFLAVLKVDLSQKKVTLVKSLLFPEQTGKTFDLDHLAEIAVACGKVHSNDLKKCRSGLDPERIGYVIKHPEDIQTEYIRILMDGSFEWVRFTVMVASADHAEEEPDVYIVSSPISQREKVNCYLIDDIELNSYKTGTVNLDLDERVVASYDQRDYHAVRNMRYSSYEEQLEYMTGTLIHPDDAEMVKRELRIENLKKIFDNGEQYYSLYYRRKLGTAYRWVECRMRRTSDYAPGKRNLILTVQDLNAALVQLYNRQSLLNYEKLTGGRGNEQTYYSTLMGAMYLLTEPFHDFFVIDVGHNAFISCKNTTGYAQNQLPSSGKYDEQIRSLSERLFDPEEGKRFLQFASLARIKEYLVNNTSVSAEFTHVNGMRILLTYTRFARTGDNQPLIVGSVKRIDNPNRLRIHTFGTFEIYDHTGKSVQFERRKAMEVLAYLVDRDGFDVTVMDIIQDVLNQKEADLNARKYASSLINHAIRSLEKLGYPDVIVKTRHAVRINKQAVDCDYYHLLNGELEYMQLYRGEYMKQYSWAEETNGSIPSYF